MKTVIYIILGFLAVLAFGFVLNVLGMVQWSFFGKWGEQIRYDIHKESQTYQDGMQRTLGNLMTEYQKADGAAKIGLRETIKHQFSQTDTSEFPLYLKDFLATEIGIY